MFFVNPSGKKVDFAYQTLPAGSDQKKSFWESKAKTGGSKKIFLGMRLVSDRPLGLESVGCSIAYNG